LNGADLFILATIGLSMAIGLARGLVVEVMSLAAWVAATLAAMTLGPRIGTLFEESIELDSARVALGYVLVFVVALVAGAIAVWLMRKIVAGTGLTGTDRMFGLFFGLARGGVIVVAMVMLGGLTPFPRDDWWQQSRALPAFEEMAGKAAAHLPAALRDNIDFSPEVEAAPEAPAVEGEART
jgi:membrane protein required for colicin V production